MKKSVLSEDKTFANDVSLCHMKSSAGDRNEVPANRQDINVIINSKLLNCTDQTPTPTRFIRNCEEVGLFQDLQNVNPFDETFRKFVEGTKTGESPSVPESKGGGDGPDDTLHTPIIFHPSNDQPQSIAENTVACLPQPPLKKIKADNSDIKHNPQCNDQQVTMEIPTKPACLLKPDAPQKKRIANTDLKNTAPILLIDRNIVSLKLPIPRVPPTIKVFSSKAFSVMTNNLTKAQPARELSSSAKTKNRRGLRKGDDLKESNRMAAIRTRQKKKHFFAYLEELNKNLEERTRELELQVTELKAENARLKQQLSDAHLTGNSKEPIISKTSDIPDQPSSTVEDEKRNSFYSSQYVEKKKEQPAKIDFILKKPIKKRRVPPKCEKES